eukprot:6941435-Pyramimonas_sp.AAC.1
MPMTPQAAASRNPGAPIGNEYEDTNYHREFMAAVSCDPGGTERESTAAVSCDPGGTTTPDPSEQPSSRGTSGGP